MSEDIEDLKKEKLRQLKGQEQKKEIEQEKKKELEKQKKKLLRKVLTSDARSRLSNLRLAKPDFTEKIELQLIQIARTGRIDLPITDEQLQKILKKFQNNKKSIDIKRK